MFIRNMTKMLALVLIAVQLFSSAVYACPDFTVLKNEHCLAPDSFFKRAVNNYQFTKDSIAEKVDFASDEIREIEVKEKGAIKRKIAIFPLKKSEQTSGKEFAFPLKKTFLVLAFLFMLDPSTVFANPDIVSDSLKRAGIETDFVESMEKPMYDLYKKIIDKKNQGSGPAYNQWVDQTARRSVDSTINDIAAGINFDIHETLDRPLVKKDGTQTNYYAALIETGRLYNINPHLLMNHTVLERLDRSNIESFTDALRSGSSRGNFQMQVGSLHRAIENLFERFPSATERDAKFPILAGYSSFNEFKSKFNVKDYLDLEKTSEQEIELASLYLWEQFFAVQDIFPGYFPDDFLINPLPADASVSEQNRLILWTFIYTSDRDKWRGMSVDRVFQNAARNMPGIYAWSRMSSRIYDYIRNISENYGYEGFQEDDFINIDEAETQRKIQTNSFWNLMKKILLAGGILALFGFLGKRYEKALERFMEKLASIFFGEDFSDSPQNNNRKRNSSNTNDYLKNQKVKKRKNLNTYKSRENSTYANFKRVNTQSKKNLRIILPGSFNEKGFDIGRKTQPLIDYLYNVSDHIMSEVSKKPELMERFPGSLQEASPKILQEVVFPYQDLKNIYGELFTSMIRSYTGNYSSDYLSLPDFLNFLEDRKSPSVINPAVIKIAA